MGKISVPSKFAGFQTPRFSLAATAVVLAMTILAAPRVWAENFDAGVENEAVMANSEGAIAEAEEAKKRADAERIRNEREQKKAQKEAERAKKVEADAKVTIAKSMAEEARLKKEREAAEIRRQAASDKIKQTQVELQARQTQLDVLRELDDKTLADRDRMEQQVRTNNDRLHMLDVQIAAEKKRKADSEAALGRSKDRLAKSNRKVQEASTRLSNLQSGRAPSSLATGTGDASTGANQEGWVRLKHDCGVNADADLNSAQTRSLKAGDQIYGRKRDSQWVEVRDKNAGSITGFIALTCLK